MASPERPRYTRIPGTEEVVKIVPPGEERCDFCYGPNPSSSYFGPDDFLTSTSYEAGEGTLDTVADPEWLACASCARVIDKRVPEILANYVTRRILARRGLTGESRQALRAILQPQLLGMYARLLPALGSRQPWAPTPGAPPVENIKQQVIRHTAPDPGEPGAN
jgi:hypothetical protein